jgi:hypothetical protein
MRTRRSSSTIPRWCTRSSSRATALSPASSLSASPAAWLPSESLFTKEMPLASILARISKTPASSRKPWSPPPPPPPLYLSSSLHSCPPWRCSSTGRRRGPTNLWTPSLRRCTPPSLLCRQRRRSRRGFWSSLRGRRAAGAGRAVQVRLQRKTSPLAPRDGESMGRPLRS